jgi:hypothetical protein
MGAILRVQAARCVVMTVTMETASAPTAQFTRVKRQRSQLGINAERTQLCIYKSSR